MWFMLRMWRDTGVRTATVAGLLAVSLMIGVVSAPGVGASAQTDTAPPAPKETTTPTPTETSNPTPAPSTPAVPTPMPTALGSWCEALFPPGKPGAERELAQGLLKGIADLNNGGTYTLTEHPNWRPQSSSDTSGDRHVNSLNWALPLLFRGVHKQQQVMVDRFRQLLLYWIEDHKGPRSYWVNASIYGGLRTQTLVCAAQTLNDPVITKAALEDAARMLDRYSVPPVIALGANNTDLIRQTGAFAAYCWTGDSEKRDRAWANLVGVSNGIIQPDGSDVEGSPGYAMYIEKLLTDVERTAKTCGIMSDNIAALRGSLYSFIAQATRPDFQLESIGDTINQSLRGTFGVGDSRADWVRSAGASGAPPADIYTNFDGGYTFGRAGWQPQPGGIDTYYSLRSTSTRPATPHAHDDGGGLTLFSRGVEWLGDPGPYRYENGSALRGFLRTRDAHSTFTVTNVNRTKSGRVLRAGARSDWQIGGNDTTCLRDATWGTVVVTRCVEFIRSVDAIVVVDYVNAKKNKKRKGLRTVTERWQLPPGISAANMNNVITMSSGENQMDVYKSSEGGWEVISAGPGSSRGWFTGEWGVKLPGAVLQRGVDIPKPGANKTMVTVFIPRKGGESVPVTLSDTGVTVTRGGQTVTTSYPVAF